MNKNYTELVKCERGFFFKIESPYFEEFYLL